ncbi:MULTISPECIES: VOC family protein [unclassified Beijerinckia]|uniref:VOC family protein n=1 Tax=unclassified Beijerinckia TaxID=2638183 RepID=UPI000897E6CA|nr:MULTISPECIES: VOC family protein [unclassified Beijerinckia]MDH7798892.1 catechol 2,3-dioxygenase-like lactoylglutathione lyase family enzyme [Beijerinckia sp. GAS462]SED87827.1 Glyoxalase-like domain-containing protein [Beijerinckia sp. 28-YEA-48]
MIGDIDSVNHVGVAVRDMEQGCALYEALGFTLSPLSVHSGSAKPGEPVQPMATGNRCAIFPHNYIEVLGIVNPGALDWSWGQFIDRFQGAHIICFGCKDASVVDARLKTAEVKTSGVIALQRDIGTEDGVKTARFDCVHFDRALTPEGLIQAARHRNPEYVHQPRYLGHRNGATSLAEVLLVTSDANATARRYETLTGQKSRTKDGDPVIDLPLATRLRFMNPDKAASNMPGTLFAPAPAIAAMTFSVTDLAAARKIITTAGFPIVEATNRFYVPAENALGVVHIFQQD